MYRIDIMPHNNYYMFISQTNEYVYNYPAAQL